MFVTTCVCVSGTTSGHYTAYCKHPLSGDWHQYNDESTCQQLPRDDDLTHAYVLFYQRHGPYAATRTRSVADALLLSMPSSATVERVTIHAWCVSGTYDQATLSALLREHAPAAGDDAPVDGVDSGNRSAETSSETAVY